LKRNDKEGLAISKKLRKQRNGKIKKNEKKF